MTRTFTLILAAIFLSGAFLRADLFVPTTQEQALASLITGSSDQKREFMALSDVLCRVARARAEDMAKRKYFDHVNPDGKGPNYLVRQAGYALPAWWGYGVKDNFVESISAGRSSASDTYGSWLNSPPHKEHVLGRTDFYKQEVVFGVGHARVSGSPYTDYWVFISVPVEEGRSIQVLTPDDGVMLKDSASGTPTALTYTGIVTGSDPVAAVRFTAADAFSPDGGGFSYATVSGRKWKTNGANWVNQGRTVLTFQSVRADGSVIGEDTIEVNRIANGTVTPPDPDPLTGAAGRYLGFGGNLFDTVLDITINNTGALSGSMIVAESTLPIVGQLSGTGDAVVNGVSLHYDSVLKTLAASVGGSTVNAMRVPKFSRTDRPTNAGSFAVIFDSGMEGMGHGFGTLKIATTGAAGLTGFLPDGSTLRMIGVVSGDGSVLIWDDSQPGVIGGTRGAVTFNATDVSDLECTLRRAAPGTAVRLDAVGCAAAKVGFLSAKNSYEIVIGGGDLDLNYYRVPISPAKGGKLVVTGDNPLALVVSLLGKTDELVGTFTHPLTQKRIVFRAKGLVKQGAAFGFFLSGGRSGYVTVTRQ